MGELLLFLRFQIRVHQLICRFLKEYDGNKYNEQFDANLAISEEPVSGSKANFLYRKGDEELQQAVDGAVQELIDEGTLAELSMS